MPYIATLRSWVARQDNIPWGRTIPLGAVPALARGLWHTAPTYLRRHPGSPSNGRLGSAPVRHGLAQRLEFDLRRSEGPSPPAGARAAEGVRLGRSDAPHRAADAGRHASGGALAARRGFRLLPDPRGARRPCAHPRAGGGGLCDGFACRRQPRISSDFSPLAARRADGPGRDGNSRAARTRRRPSSRISCSYRSRASTGGGIASATARAIMTAAWRSLGRSRKSMRSESLTGFAKSQRCLMRRMTRAWMSS